MKQFRKFIYKIIGGNVEDFIDLNGTREIIEAEVYRELSSKVDKYAKALLAATVTEIDAKVETLLKARASAKSLSSKKSYNGTIKELRELRSFILNEPKI